jgi:CHAT domain-containing protein
VLHVDVDDDDAGARRVRVTLYVPETAQPVAPHHEVTLAPERWDELRPRRIRQFDQSVAIGRALWRELLSKEIQDQLARHADRPLVVLGDEEASSLPWELLAEDRDGAPARAGGVVRRIALRGPYRAPADQVERSRLRVLLVADPRDNLPNAVPEAEAIRAALGGRADVIVEHLYREDATVARVKAELARGYHDVFHYAGHANFDELERDRGGLVLADGTLTAADLPAISPQLVFLSACESGRLRDLEPGPPPPRVRGNGRPLAEVFVRAGVRAFVGTFYVVDDANARAFASAVHGQLAAGKPLGDAMRAARRALYDGRRPDWGNFLLYGDDGLIL